MKLSVVSCPLFVLLELVAEDECDNMPQTKITGQLTTFPSPFRRKFGYYARALD